MASQTSSSHSAVDLTGITAVFASSYICAGLWGISTLQAYIYYLSYPKDSVFLKLMIVWIWILGTVHQVLVIKGTSRPLLLEWGNVEELAKPPPEFIWQTLLTGLSSATVQVFFTFRVWIFVRQRYSSSILHRLYPIIFVPAAFSQLIADIIRVLTLVYPTYTYANLDKVYIAESRTLNNIAQFDGTIFKNCATAAISVSVAVDILLSALMTRLFLSERGLSVQTCRIISYLIFFALASGIITSVIAIVSLITSLVVADQLYYAAVYFFLSPLYTNTLLANLNAREFVKSKGLSDGITLAQLSPGEPIELGMFTSNTRTSESRFDTTALSTTENAPKEYETV